MVVISGGWGRIRTWINKRIRIKAIANTFVGEDSGKITTGGYNSFIGYQSGYKNTSGYRNSFQGYQSGYNNTSGYYNNFIGYRAGFLNTTGYNNNFIGYQTGYNNLIGHHNIFIGSYAGYYETGNNKLFVDYAPRADEADARIKALIYGVFDAATANQRLSINAQLLVREVATYADDAAAGTGGLVTGEIYKHADGSLHIKL